MLNAIVDTAVKTATILTDGWANVFTKLGVAGADKRLGAVAHWDPLTEVAAEELYAGDDIAANIVDCLPEDAMREGFDLIGWEGADPVKAIEAEFARLGLHSKLEETWKYARTYGGAGLLMVTDDATEMALPLDLAKVTTLSSLVPLTRYELRATEDIERDVRSPNFGLPNTYALSPQGGQALVNQRVHYTRVIRFDGNRLTPRLFVRNQYWGDSVLTRAYNAIRNFNQGHDAAALALQDFRVGVFKLKNLANLIANNKDETIVKRLQTIQLSKSIARAIVISDDESWEEKATNFTGIPDILSKLKERLQAAAQGIPHTRLFGESPQGLGGSGRSTEVTWYDHVSSRQEQYLRPRLMKALQVICAQGSLSVELPADAGITFRPLWQLDEKENVEMRAKQAETDAKYIENGVLDPAEIRAARFSSKGYSIDTTIEELGEAPLGAEDPALAGASLPAPAANESVQAQALNGAQLASIVGVVEKVVAKLIPFETGVELILIAFPYLDKAKAEQLLAATKGFEPATPPAGAAPIAGA